MQVKEPPEVLRGQVAVIQLAALWRPVGMEATVVAVRGGKRLAAWGEICSEVAQRAAVGSQDAAGVTNGSDASQVAHLMGLNRTWLVGVQASYDVRLVDAWLLTDPNPVDPP